MRCPDGGPILWVSLSSRAFGADGFCQATFPWMSWSVVSQQNSAVAGWSMLFTSSVSGLNVMADQLMLKVSLLKEVDHNNYILSTHLNNHLSVQANFLHTVIRTALSCLVPFLWPVLYCHRPLCIDVWFLHSGRIVTWWAKGNPAPTWGSLRGSCISSGSISTTDSGTWGEMQKHPADHHVIKSACVH